MTIVLWVIIIVLVIAFISSLADSINTKLRFDQRLIGVVIAILLFSMLIGIFDKYAGGIML